MLLKILSAVLLLASAASVRGASALERPVGMVQFNAGPADANGVPTRGFGAGYPGGLMEVAFPRVREAVEVRGWTDFGFHLLTSPTMFAEGPMRLDGALDAIELGQAWIVDEAWEFAFAVADLPGVRRVYIYVGTEDAELKNARPAEWMRRVWPSVGPAVGDLRFGFVFDAFTGRSDKLHTFAAALRAMGHEVYAEARDAEGNYPAFMLERYYDHHRRQNPQIAAEVAAAPAVVRWLNGHAKEDYADPQGWLQQIADDHTPEQPHVAAVEVLTKFRAEHMERVLARSRNGGPALLDGRPRRGAFRAPATAGECLVLYAYDIWGHTGRDAMPSVAWVKERLASKTIPEHVILDIEHLDGQPDLIVSVVKLYREILPPGTRIGVYGAGDYNPNVTDAGKLSMVAERRAQLQAERAVGDACDFVVQTMYANQERDFAAWAVRNRERVRHLREVYGPDKMIVPFLWGKFHGGHRDAAIRGQMIPADFFEAMLDFCEAHGLTAVLWDEIRDADLSEPWLRVLRDRDPEGAFRAYMLLHKARDPRADLDSDGKVDVNDLLAYLGQIRDNR